VTIGPTAVEDAIDSSGVSLPVGYSLGVSSGAAEVAAVDSAAEPPVDSGAPLVGSGAPVVGSGAPVVGSALVGAGVEEGSSGAGVEDGVEALCAGGTSSCSPVRGVVDRPHEPPAVVNVPP
jgi:hypothetical protein